MTDSERLLEKAKGLAGGRTSRAAEIYALLSPLKTDYMSGNHALPQEKEVTLFDLYSRAASELGWKNEAEYYAAKALELAVECSLREEASLIADFLMSLYLERHASRLVVRVGDVMLPFCEVDDLVSNFAFNLCCGYFIEGRFSDCRDLAVRMLDFEKEYGEYLEQKTSWLYYFAYNYGETENPEDVLQKWYDFQCRLYGPESPQAMEVLCHIAINTGIGGDFRQAICLFENALDILTDDDVTFRIEGIAWYYMMFAIVLKEDGQKERALEACDLALSACGEDFSGIIGALRDEIEALEG